MVVLMASSVSASTFPCSLSSSSFTSCSSYSQSPKLFLSFSVSPLGFNPFPPWSGLKHMTLSFRPKSLCIEMRRRRRRCKGKVVYASLFGVGAPEALVIGVVALLVFGPKGLAEVARNLGKTLRAFQPTIRELQEVSREFKSSLEREIGLDDVSSAVDSTYSTYSPIRTNTTTTPSPITNTEDSGSVVDPNGVPPPSTAYTSEEYLKITEEQLKASTAQQPLQPTIPEESQMVPKLQAQGTVEDPAVAVQPQKPGSET